jgi:hypothetical protein
MGRLQDQITLDTLTAVTANRNSGVFNLSGYTSGALYFNFTTVTGTTPTLVPLLQASVDGGTTWAGVPAALQAVVSSITAAGLTVVPFLLPFALSLCRINYTITGTTPVYTGVAVGLLNHP